MIDSHCHLFFDTLATQPGGIEGVIQRAKDKGVTHMLNVAVDLPSSKKTVELAQQYKNIYASIGVHPCHVTAHEIPDCKTLIDLAQSSHVVALGETGLDYHTRDGIEPDNGIKAAQRESLVNHMQCARMLNLPVIIHTRDADQDMIQFLNEHTTGCSGVLHCFTGSLALAKAAISQQFYISVSGIITFTKTKSLHAVIKEVPLERLLIETDAPYLAPAPYRGKPNEPAHVTLVAEKLAQIKDVSLATILDITTENFCRLFKVDIKEAPTTTPHS